MARFSVVAVLAVACSTSTALTLPNIFGQPRTRARALAYAKKAVLKNDVQDDNASFRKAATLKVSRRGRADMVLSPEHVPGAYLRAPLHLTSLLTPRAVAGDVVAPAWLLPLAALSCYSFPIMICYFSGDLEKDLYSRSISGVTLRQRATADFLNWLTRRGVMAEQTSPSADLG